MNHSSSLLLRGAGMALALFTLAGCASGPFQASTPRETASKTVDRTAGDVAEINGRIDGALRALGDLVNHPTADLKRQFKVYTDAVDALERSANDLGNRSADVQSAGQAYFIAWDREIATIRNQDLRERSAERKDEVMRGFDEVRTQYVEAREALVPLVRSLQEVETALAVDLTSAGMSNVQPSFDRVSDQAGPAREALAELAEELRTAQVALAAEVSGIR